MKRYAFSSVHNCELCKTGMGVQLGEWVVIFALKFNYNLAGVYYKAGIDIPEDLQCTTYLPVHGR